ncbi:hypothetical protein [Alkaliphilus transvaalensis]|uniref:hypothetical protein n=1 Tax=Alkaliphilus transvaalensis TaxID=114628 RepID=UPI00047B4FF0|nr:hypothetical protein [Alkaliphilus transvaalensis]
MKKFSDEELEELLFRTLEWKGQPDEALNIALKKQLLEREKGANRANKKEKSIWWLPALSSIMMTSTTILCLIILAINPILTSLISFFLITTNASTILLTLIGVRKFSLKKEAVL